MPKPATTWLFLDEHPDSINDGFFDDDPLNSGWSDIPSSLHAGACGFSFVDGQAELKKWLSRTSRFPVQYAYPNNVPTFDAAGRLDFAWWLQRSGFMNLSGQRLYGYECHDARSRLRSGLVAVLGPILRSCSFSWPRQAGRGQASHPFAGLNKPYVNSGTWTHFPSEGPHADKR